jgi:Icc protein
VFLDQGKQYLQVFGQGSHGSGYWSFDLQGIHFIGLANDSGLVGKGQGTLGAEQLSFIKKDIAGLSSSTPLVLFSHVPLLPVYVPWGWATSDSGQLLALVNRFQTVTALNGHIHQVVSKRIGNVVMHTANSTAYPLHPPGQVAPSPLVVPAAQLPTRIGIRAVQAQGAYDTLAVKDQPLA